MLRAKIEKGRKDAVRYLKSEYAGKRKKHFEEFEKSTDDITEKSLVSVTVFGSLVSRGDMQEIEMKAGQFVFIKKETCVRDILDHYFPGEKDEKD